MLNVNVFKVALATLVVSAALSPALAQGTTTLRNPLIPGAQSTGPGVPAADGAPEIPGEGPTGLPEIKGMTGPPTLLPWVPAVPANDIDMGNSGINLGITPAIESPPGVLGPSLTGIIPPPPSTPGADPGILQVPPDSPSFNPALETGVLGGGQGLPGVGGDPTNGTIPNARKGGQTTQQFERRGLNVAFGAGSGAKGSIQDEVARTGVLAGYGLPYGVPTGNGFANASNSALPGGSDLRNSSIDLGGGQRIKVGGQIISTGSSIQDFGLSDLRNNPVAALQAQQSTDFGQGWRRITSVYSSTTTDFGLPYQQFNAANDTQQQRGQLLNPNAIETNF
jgi:hypothetical protein